MLSLIQEKKLYSRINNWNDFNKILLSSSNKEKGDYFESLTKFYFKLNPVYKSKYQNVWLLEEVPQKILNTINIPRQDLGIDLILESDNEFHAVQCKYHSNKNQSITNKEISTFTSLLANKSLLTHGYICSTAIKTSKNYRKLEIKNISDLLWDDWSKLDKLFFQKVRYSLNNKKIIEKPFKPFKHQDIAIDKAFDYFVNKKNERGKLILPCGAGKSLTGYWINKKLKSKKTLIAVPSLNLISQTLEVYLKQVVADNLRVKWLCICSDQTVGRGDDIITYTSDLGIPTTTDSNYIRKWINKNKNNNIIIFTTYQSGKVIADVAKKNKTVFDVGIFDEAHKTVGKNENQFSYLIFENNISIKKRIFMTATERFFRGKFDDVLTMDDPDDYGEVFHKMTFKEAIRSKLLCDYEIITMDIKKEEISNFIKDNNLVKMNKRWGLESEARSIASMIALRKAMKEYPIKNAISFHSSIERAKRNLEIQSYISDHYNFNHLNTFFVSGKIPTQERNDIIKDFANTEYSLIGNSRCLTEGIDVPNIDCIVFADPKRSKVDIVQALGRVLRKKKGKIKGYVILPLIYDEKIKEIDNENYQDIWNIIKGLASNDERIIEYFSSRNKSSFGSNKPNDPIIKIDPTLIYDEKIINEIEIKLWKGLSRFNYVSYEEAQDILVKNNVKSQTEYYKFWKVNGKKFNLPYHPSRNYKEKWKNWGQFLGTGRLKSGLIKYATYKQSSNYGKSMGFLYSKHWTEHYQSGKMPIQYPGTPAFIYKKEWKGWGHFLQTGEVATYKLTFWDFKKSKKFVANLKLKNQAEWFEYVKSGKKPKMLHSNPQRKFKNNEWKSWGDFLGTGRIANQKKNFLSFIQARKIVRTFKLKGTQQSWKHFCNSGKKPENIPSHPAQEYKDEWKGYADFMGVESSRKPNKVKNAFNIMELKKVLKINKISSRKDFYSNYELLSKKYNNRIPKNPPAFYIRKKEWIDWENLFK